MSHIQTAPPVHETAQAVTIDHHTAADAAAVPGYPAVWNNYRLIAFRIAALFIIAFSVPTTAGWYNSFASIDWTHLHYRDLYDVARFSPPHFTTIKSESGRWGALAWVDWGILLLIATAGGLLWTLLDRKRKEYNLFYYWLLVIARYRAGIGIIGFGFTKLLPVQMPYPSVSLLNNNFGDLTGHKVFWLSIGIVPWYQVFTGIVEVAAGSLLFFRKTAALGAALLIGALGSITIVNLGYDGGVHVYASYFVLLGFFVWTYYIPRIYKLLILEQYTIPIDIYPSFPKKWQRFGRVGVKTGIIGVFLVWLFYLQLVNFLYDPYKQPSTPGVASLRGYYNVTEFRLNDQVIPYNPLDSNRWNEVTFEQWSSLTFKVNKPVSLDLSNGGGGPMKDVNKSFEVSGVAGGRRVFQYFADTVTGTLYLQDKNNAALKRNDRSGEDNEASAKNIVKDTAKFWIPKEALAHIGDENKKINARASSARRDRAFAAGLEDEGRSKMVLKYTAENGGARVILKGVNEYKDSVYLLLDRIDKKYALSESSLHAGSYQ